MLTMKQVYLENSYLKEIKTKIGDVDGIFATLEDNIFYPTSGGQPNDTGVIIRGKDIFKVLSAKKIAGSVSLEMDKPGLKKGEEVVAKIDWEKRHRLMR